MRFWLDYAIAAGFSEIYFTEWMLSTPMTTRRVRLRGLRDAYVAWAVPKELTPTMIATSEKPETLLVDLMRAMNEKGYLAYEVKNAKSTLSITLNTFGGHRDLGNRPLVRAWVNRLNARVPPAKENAKVYSPVLLIDWMDRTLPNEELTWHALQAKFATQMILYIMLRPTELFHIEPGSITFDRPADGATVFITSSKTSHGRRKYRRLYRVLEYPKRCAVNCLETYLQKRDDASRSEGIPRWQDAFFVTKKGRPMRRAGQVSAEIRDVMTQAGVPRDATPYSLKHCAVTYHLDRGTTPSALAVTTNHSLSANTLERHYHRQGPHWAPRDIIELRSGQSLDVNQTGGEGVPTRMLPPHAPPCQTGGKSATSSVGKSSASEEDL
jgi:hypothetical protein